MRRIRGCHFDDVVLSFLARSSLDSGGTAAPWKLAHGEAQEELLDCQPSQESVLVWRSAERILIDMKSLGG